jgi:hypothetical protein
MQGILIFYYLGGAGGKFIANCLTYSGQVAFSNYSIALRNNPEEYNSELLKTIPDKSNSRSWLALEHGCGQLFGPGTSYIKQQGQVPAAVEFNDLTMLKDKWLPIMAHHKHEVVNIQKYFSDCPQRLIVVDADPDFIDLAIKLKWADPAHCLDLDLYKEFKQEIAVMNYNYMFTDWDPRRSDAIDCIKDFAWRVLDIPLDLTPAADYIEKYLAFHS